MTVVAVKVTEVPAQTGLALAAIDMLAGRLGFTVNIAVDRNIRIAAAGGSRDAGSANLPLVCRGGSAIDRR